MFNDKYRLTESVLNKRKIQTRRIISNKLINEINSFQEEYFNATLDVLYNKDLIETYFINYPDKFPYKINEIIAIAQSYQDIFSEFNQQLNIDIKNFISTAGWTNKMFMKSELMPHQIKITNVKIEYLQDINDEDYFKEGI